MASTSIPEPDAKMFMELPIAHAKDLSNYPDDPHARYFKKVNTIAYATGSVPHPVYPVRSLSHQHHPPLTPKKAPPTTIIPIIPTSATTTAVSSAGTDTIPAADVFVAVAPAPTVPSPLTSPTPPLGALPTTVAVAVGAIPGAPTPVAVCSAVTPSPTLRGPVAPFAIATT